jgi:hypothetical protein
LHCWLWGDAMHGLAPQKCHLTIALADVVAHRRLSDRSVGEAPRNSFTMPNNN